VAEPQISTRQFGFLTACCARLQRGMKEPTQTGRVHFRALALLAAVVLFETLRSSIAQELRVTQVAIDAQGRFTVRHGADTNAYYVLRRGAAVTNIVRPVDVALGEARDSQTAEGRLSDITPLAGQAFYRVQRVRLDQPLDLDGDGIDDVFELRHPSFLNPLNPQDAQAGFDHDGRSNLREYLDHTDPAVSKWNPIEHRLFSHLTKHWACKPLET
jgi:Rhodopirellula transposase DDE domain